MTTTTHHSTGSVAIGDFASNAPTGCGEGKHRRDALSGGFANPNFNLDSSKLFFFGFNPTGYSRRLPLPGGASWRTTVANRGEGSRGAGRLTTFVYCDPRRRGLRLRWASVPIRPLAKATVTVRCGIGSEAVSGGFSDENAGTNGSLVFGFRSKRVGEHGWRASAFNLSDSFASRLIVLVNCDPRQPGLAAHAKSIAVPADSTRSTQVRCPGRHEAWSAGFESNVSMPKAYGAFPYELARVRRQIWRASAFAEGPATSFTAYVYCATHYPYATDAG